MAKEVTRSASTEEGSGSGVTGMLEQERYLPSGDEAGTPPEDRAFRPDVEGLRAVTMLLIVLVHAGVPQMQGGTVGQDAFFVISGFVITGVLLREHLADGGISFLHFYARRARRILPMAMLVIVVVLVAVSLLASHRDAVAAASDGRWSALFLGNFHFANVDPNVLVPRQSPFGQYWSLAVEEQFYLVYPAFFLLLMAVPGSWSVGRRLAIGLIGVVVSSFAVSVITSAAGQLGPYYSPFTRAWELAFGGLVALATPYLKGLPTAVAAALTWAGLLGLVLAAHLVTVVTPWPGYIAAVPVACVALIILGGAAAPRWGAEVLLGSPPFRWVGKWTYSWYLWHLAFIVMAAEYGRVLYGSLSVTLRLALCGLALIVAAISYFFIENPIRHSKRMAQSPRATLIGAVLLVASCVGLTFAF